MPPFFYIEFKGFKMTALDFDDYSPDDSQEQKDLLLILQEKAEEAAHLETVISDIEEELLQVKGRQRELLEKELVQLMGEIGLNKFELIDGTKLSIKNFVSGSLNKAPDFEYAKNWVIENDGGDLIKSEVSLSFDRGQHNAVLSLKAELEEKGYDPRVSEGIHPSTYAAFIREKIAEYEEGLKKGENVVEPPLDKLGVFAGRKVDVKVKKVK